MVQVSDVAAFLDETAPQSLAESWDNVGLLIGDGDRRVSTIMTCLTLTPDVATEAIEHKAQLIVSHHPILFRPVQRLTNDTVEGRMLLNLIAAGISVYSPHTGYDSARTGINRQLATLLELKDVRILRPSPAPDAQISSAEAHASDGAGRYGALPAPVSLGELCQVVKSRLQIEYLQFVGDKSMPIKAIGIACGAAAEFLRDAVQAGCQALLTGEARFHDCLEARSNGFALILPGHYATERPAMEYMADRILTSRFPDVTIWASRKERDPICWMA